ncbi:MAG TPA: hypothetical protein VEF04_05490 [Blastocatellia bacterium]|nr:hypothetical protein [Blastocatellia bacterium]
MRRILAGLILFVGLAALAHAEPKPKVAGRTMPNPGSYSSEAVYITSSTCIENSAILISSRSSLVYGVFVTTPAAAGSVRLWDSRILAAGRPLTNKIDATTAQPWHYNVGASSGIVLNNTGGACVDVVYMEVH